MSSRNVQNFVTSSAIEEEDEDEDYSLLSLSTSGPSSPINLQSKDAIPCENLIRRPLQVYYNECRDTVLENTGSTLSILPPSTCDLSGGPLPDGSIFRLSEILFRWGRDNQQGSEHTVNGHAFPMEVQLIHFNVTLFSSYEEALGQPNGVAIISLFVQVGLQNNGLQVITQNLWHVRYKEETKVITALFNPESFLPHPTLRDFWTYRGTLTWHPYSENVDWILMRYPMMVSPLQLEDFRQLLTCKKGEIVPSGADVFLVDNFRPVQSLRGRVILSNFQ